MSRVISCGLLSIFLLAGINTGTISSDVPEPQLRPSGQVGAVNETIMETVVESAAEPEPEQKPESELEESVEVEEHDWVTFEVTGYTLREQECGKPPDHPLYGVTTSGKMAELGVTVAAGKGVPFGTKIYIQELKWFNGTGIFEVHDRGGAVTENCIDVFFGDPELDPDCVRRALDFGRRKLKGVVLE